MSKEKDLSGIILPEGKMLVELLPNYFTEHKVGSLDKTIRENQNYFVGLIKLTTSSFDDVDKIIYFHKDLCPVINIKGIGEYHLVGKNEWFIILPKTISNQ